MTKLPADAKVELVARAISEAGGAAHWEHALNIARFVLAALEQSDAEQGEAVCRYCDGRGIYYGKDIATGQSVELACQYCNETGIATPQVDKG
jgi:hypothetical protein